MLNREPIWKFCKITCFFFNVLNKQSFIINEFWIYKFKWNTLYLPSFYYCSRGVLILPKITSGEHELCCSLQPSYRLRLFRQFFPRGDVLKSNCLRTPYLVVVDSFWGPKYSKGTQPTPDYQKTCLFATYITFPIADQ